MAFSVHLVLSLLVVTAVVTSVVAISVEEHCLGCICEASTNCTVNTPCKVPRPGSYLCGPFLISYAYWADAGQPVIAGDDPNKKGAFESCTLDLLCAAETVEAYMTKFQQDCDGDGIITCYDYMKIHKLGGYGCSTAIADKTYTNYYDLCAKAFNLDCNNDGKIDCEDHVRIHGMGGYGCSDKSFETTKLYKQFSRCYEVVRAATASHTPNHNSLNLIKSPSLNQFQRQVPLSALEKLAPPPPVIRPQRRQFVPSETLEQEDYADDDYFEINLRF